ncbi:MAG TPA: hypothetical protein DD738_00225 [Ruminiclostridium sp.]|nr:hypothetical protein [Ruminiclostridium sp.]
MGCKEQVVPGLIGGEDICKLREAVCVHVEKVYDNCREKDCVEDAVVDFVDNVQDLISNAVKVKTKDAEVVAILADLEDVPFKRGFFTVNVRYKIRVVVEFCYKDVTGNIVNSSPKVGFVWFSKTVILFGSEGKIKIFRSVDPHNTLPIRCEGCNDGCGGLVEQDNLPIIKVEVAEPIILNTRIKRVHERHQCGCDEEKSEVTNLINGPQRRVVVTIGLFSIIKLVRLVQLLIPAFNFCYPNKECIASTDENPCEIFDTIEFPLDQFFPPQKFDFPGLEEPRC